MDDKKRAQFDKEFEKLKKKAERKERKNALYKPVTTLYFEKALYNSLRALEIRFEKKFATDEELKEIENKIDGLHNKFDILFEKLDWFTGKYTMLIMVNGSKQWKKRLEYMQVNKNNQFFACFRTSQSGDSLDA
ncbi:MAG: hypothetical protein UV63_C0008G0002 [Microgenomates group bacterium GW2011_GWC1_43_11]|nr:MAG: hypothetical protein UV63_C0008G0002 [Microgenomates group bacterium GW2011_GWC1_43_11]